MKNQHSPEQQDHRKRVRLSLRSSDSAPGQLDGGWWPRSTKLLAELETLAAAVRSRIGPLDQVQYRPDMWTPSPAQTHVDGLNVRLTGARSMDPQTILVRGTGARQLRLLVIPPTVHHGVAHAVLRASTTAGPTTTAADILASNGALDSDSRVVSAPAWNSVHVQSA